MQCERCKTKIPEGGEHAHLGQVLCEDCYMDALSPVRTCDPWAVHSAKMFEAQTGGQATLNASQKKILEILEESGGIQREALVQRMGAGFSDADLEREFAPLRHMEKVRAEKRGDKVYLRLW
jgi:late competence protein required for DNA uptake (superfamily II DNA/RNA helicase)